MCNASRDGGDGAQDRVSGTAKPNDFPAYAILLCGERERYEGDAWQVLHRDGSCEEPLLADPALDVL
jgi:hypothetical protein